MKFTIGRTSGFYDIRKPCENAVLSKHKTRFDEDLWEIEIASLEELVKLKEEVNYPIIIKNPYFIEGQNEIEIYDDYRE